MSITLPVLLKSDDLFGKDNAADTYDRSRELSRYLLMHYGTATDVFDDLGHPLAPAHGFPGRLSRVLESAARRSGLRVARMLDGGCNVGGVAHELSSWVERLVVGVDLSERTIEIARTIAMCGGGKFSVSELGPFTRDVELRLPAADGRAAVRFEVGDAGALSPGDGPYDAVLLSNVLDRVEDPAACLAQFADDDSLLRSGGMLAVACPWSWSPEYSDTGLWLGSAEGRTTSETALKSLLSGRGFALADEVNLGGVLRQNPREYDYFDAHVTVWIKS
ncbi:SAM-dependent methyltransferase [Catenulispora sp. EB89]|uniref:class I SAM-dependent methyltransferase n=1 Tax=Catenulispora sp. EB89 TaxID=3156257 RepID=UPI0035177D39